MVWSLFIFCEYSAREPASIIWNAERGDRILLCGPTHEPMVATANTGKTRETFEKMQLNEPGGYKLVQGRNPWQLVKHAWLYSDLLQALKGEPSSSWFSTIGSVISVSALPHCWG